MDKIEEIVREVFNISLTYILSKSEKKRLFTYVQEASSPEEARLYRLLDCSAFCEDDCFFWKALVITVA